MALYEVVIITGKEFEQCGPHLDNTLFDGNLSTICHVLRLISDTNLIEVLPESEQQQKLIKLADSLLQNHFLQAFKSNHK